MFQPWNFHHFYTFNQAPLISIYGLPYIGEAGVAPRGEGDLRLTMDLANSYIREINSGETIELDGESLRLTLTGHYGIGSNLELGIDVPFIIVGGGFLDHFIEDYHHAFGFPDGGREDAPDKPDTLQISKKRRHPFKYAGIR